MTFTIGKYFSEEAKKYGMSVQTCFEDNTLVELQGVNVTCNTFGILIKLILSTKGIGFFVQKRIASTSSKQCNKKYK